MTPSMTTTALNFQQSLTCAALAATMSIATFSLVANVMTPLFVDGSPPSSTGIAATMAAQQFVCRDEWLRPDATMRRPTII